MLGHSISSYATIYTGTTIVNDDRDDDADSKREQDERERGRVRESYSKTK